MIRYDEQRDRLVVSPGDRFARTRAARAGCVVVVLLAGMIALGLVKYQGEDWGRRLGIGPGWQLAFGITLHALFKCLRVLVTGDTHFRIEVSKTTVVVRIYATVYRIPISHITSTCVIEFRDGYFVGLGCSDRRDPVPLDPVLFESAEEARQLLGHLDAVRNAHVPPVEPPSPGPNENPG
ncbi:hypothetical protein GobsT_45290 [Gemmata obscuriglobus]|uniref:Uncharacterized protein n=1 Tax=Gemmata obscuriglobus TaxID=114 RepID=A0A2Z3GSY3_9BACT|nr:hypothetical protein [Gemmata obscuriglobus]AWM37499.1 hypothetical protein C1280_11045 [Gemmata obscuriglobus]QEG29731.1 hypothetical protein GobsT_45290 [Gemmata obscuriglobus]VTS09048.1 unnamed protein product [Gemmata obscuriglobus UQM 2246]